MAGILAQGAPTYRCAPTQTAANHVAAHVTAGLRMPNFGETAPSRPFDSKGQRGKGQSPVLGSRTARRLLKSDIIAFGCDPYLVGERRGARETDARTPARLVSGASLEPRQGIAYVA